MSAFDIRHRIRAVGTFVLSIVISSLAVAEGSRSLHPSTYPSVGARSNLDLQAGQRYANRINRRGFIYVYAEADEYILLGSSNIGSSGDIEVFNPQDFGTPGDETIPGSADFSCSSGTAEPGDHQSGGTLGRIANRATELAGPNSVNNSVTVTDGWAPCVYQAPESGIYGVLFGTGTGSGPNGNVASTPSSDDTAAAWDVTVRDSNTSLVDINGRVFTYAFVGFTGGNSRPVFFSLYYVTNDGYRYRQDMRGLDPNGYALYANTFGFFDNNEPLYKTLRGSDALVADLPAGITAQAAQFPIFFSDISSGAAAEPAAELVLGELGIPLVPPSPQISNVSFTGTVSGNTTAQGVGGTFAFDTSDTVSYEIVISLDGADYDPAHADNRVLTGIAFSGSHEVEWDGLNNDNQPFPARPQPYDYRAFGRAGEVHFPIIDAENNGQDGTAVPGGGPTITRLNGSDAGSTIVFFDDRGYVTSSGEPVGILNGFLCGAASPAATIPPEQLSGIDSTGVYRQWGNGGNANNDCVPSAGWGDAKGVNLWTYFLTPAFDEELLIVGSPVDVATSVTVASTAPGSGQVQGTFSFGNNGDNPAADVTYTMTMTTGLTGVTFGNLPGIAMAMYNSVTGEVVLSGFPDTLAAGEVFSGMTFRYDAPSAGTVTVQTMIGTSDDDAVPANNTDNGSTSFGDFDLVTEITGVPATADPNTTVGGRVEFSNRGAESAIGVTYELVIGGPMNTVEDLDFTSLPNGVTASYNTISGVVTLTGMPNILAPGSVLALPFTYTGPITENGSVPITAQIGTGAADANPANDSDSAGTQFAFAPNAALQLNVQSVCINDAPYLTYTVQPQNFTPTTMATIELLGSDNGVVRTLNDQPFSGTLLWPEAAVGPGGEGIAWPGWEENGRGGWRPVSSTVRPTLTVRVSVNPAAQVTVNYPPASPACNVNPASFGLPQNPVPALPLPWMMFLLAAVLLSGARMVARAK